MFNFSYSFILNVQSLFGLIAISVVLLRILSLWMFSVVHKMSYHALLIYQQILHNSLFLFNRTASEGVRETFRKEGREELRTTRQQKTSVFHR